MSSPLDLHAIRAQFPGLARTVAGQQALFLDGPAGSQVPRCVADAVHDVMLHHNANHGGSFATSVETDAMVDRARAACATFVGGSADEVVFGPNMTTLTFQLSRALARTWQPGDEVVVTASDHDANVTPWVLAARDAGAVVRTVPLARDEAGLDLEALAALLSPRTRLVAVGACSNLSGTVHDVARICAMARAAGALTYVDAVHWAPHFRTDVRAWGCDFLACSAYKFFGPHVGILWGRRELLARLEPYKVRPAADEGPERWQQGTANFACIAGTLAAVEYLASLGGTGDLAARLDATFARICAHETDLARRMLEGLGRIDGVRILGVTNPARAHARAATFSFTHPAARPAVLAQRLADAGVFCWSGNSYALNLSQALGLEPHGVLRVGLLHYHTAAEVERFLALLPGLLHA